MRYAIALLLVTLAAACQPELISVPTEIARDSTVVDCELTPTHPECLDDGGTIGTGN